MSPLTTCLPVLLVVASGACAAPAPQRYTSKYDGINLDEILANRRLLVPYVKCILDQSRCTAEGKELKAHISDALQSGCSDCTPAQRDGAHKVIGHLIRHEHALWQELVDKYDKTRQYTRKYEDELKNIDA